MDIRSVTSEQFREDLEGAVNSVIQKIRGDGLSDWNEDYITRELLYEYRQRFRKIEIKSGKKVIQITSEAYKLSGRLKAEPRFGDIALIVRIRYSDKIVEGVAFLEAKKKQEGGNNFDAIKRKQLETIYEHAPHALLLLYDYENIANDQDYKLQKPYGIRSSRSIHAVTLPINLALNFDIKNTTLYRFSSPLSYQVLGRYFRGLDLEFSKEAVKIAKGYMRDLGLPKFLVVISAVVSSDGHGEAPSRIEYNTDIFGEL